MTALEEQKLHTELMIAGSITAISGVSDITTGGEDLVGLDAEIKGLLPF